ncbi:hypothetical protein ACELLULO517_08025 [Acidisoma cellulosilytica]|uniref:Uncharacterized protein n=1 Tax=Acidisoma cellulosilyticum TaxID=2802395 RepID=A0A963YZQ7_9PROT|nr:hypothetical protein [Acidisoma cellulosilyticum]MCB8880177.1 hypothetical protein [Acidisoma cellulosilyticum]
MAVSADALELRMLDVTAPEAQGSDRIRNAALGQRLSDLLAILLWIVIFLHPLALIALSFYWGLL